MPDRSPPEESLTLQLTQIARPRCAVLRLRNADAAALEQVSSVLSAPLPSTPNRASGEALWLAPGEWLLTGGAASENTIARLSAALGDRTHHIADVSNGRCVFAISGSLARDLLARGCSLDLHSRVFETGYCAQTLFAQVPALLHRVSADPVFHLYADISHEAYLTAWFRGVLRFFPSGVFS